MSDAADVKGMTPAQWARYMGWSSPGNAYAALKAGRVVLDAAGLIDPQASRARYLASANPDKAGVTERHAQARAAKARDTGTPPLAAAQEEKDDPRSGPDPQAVITASRALKERYQALAAKLAYDTAIGKLRDAAEVEQLAAQAGAELRVRMEAIAPLLAPQLAVMDDEGAIRARIQDEVQAALMAAVQRLRKLTQAGAPA